MKRKRERLDVIHDILVAIRDARPPVRPTHVLYGSNLSSQMLKDYLAELIETGIVVERDDDGKTSYELSDKAYDFLSEYARIQAFLESYGLD